MSREKIFLILALTFPFWLTLLSFIIYYAQNPEFFNPLDLICIPLAPITFFYLSTMGFNDKYSDKLFGSEVC